MKLTIPTTGLREYVYHLASVHGVAYTRTELDALRGFQYAQIQCVAKLSARSRIGTIDLRILLQE